MVRANGSVRPSPSVTPGPGAATPAFGPSGTPLPGSAAAGLQPVVGINFGNSYASIAVLTSEGLSECIATEDGERQIAAVISYHGDETYIGNQAIPQLLKNSKNTIVGFRDLLGKKFSEISQAEKSSTRSAPVIEHPSQPDVPAYSVQASADSSAAPRIISVSEAATLFLASLLQSAQDFLGAPASGAVLTYPPSFTLAQKQALKVAAEAAGITVLQLLDEAGAVAVATSEVPSSSDAPSDRIQLQLDLGASSLALQLIQIRQGLAVLLSHSISTKISTADIDKTLIDFFAKDFTKKNKIPLDLPHGDKRAQTLFEQNLPFTKRTLSATAKTAASLSIESLKDGYDYTGSINRMRFSMLAQPVFGSIATAVSDLLASASVDARQVDEVVLVGGGGCLPGLLESLSAKLGLGTEDEPVASPDLDPTEVLARGCASQAGLIHGLSVEEDADIRAVFEKELLEDVVEVDAISKTIGIVVSPAPNGAEKPRDGEAIIPVVWVDTPIPARRSCTFEPAGGKVTVEVVEAEEYIFTEKVTLPKLENDDDEDEEEEEEEEEVKHRSWRKSGSVGKVELETKGKGGKVTVEITVTKDGKLAVEVREDGEGGAVATL